MVAFNWGLELIAKLLLVTARFLSRVLLPYLGRPPPPVKNKCNLLVIEMISPKQSFKITHRQTGLRLCPPPPPQGVKKV